MSHPEPPAWTVADTLQLVKPRLRGWLHAATFPLAVVAGIALVVLSPTGPARAANAVFAVTAALMFGVSAVFHRRTWSPRGFAVIQRLDHATIFLIIAGTYTPFTFLLLEGTSQIVLLLLVWVGALAGIAFRVFWLGAPRWLYTPVYIALGWAAAFWMPQFWANGGPAVFFLVLAGGLLYSVGGLVYAARRPDPAPRWFGFHEVFHTLTVLAFASHSVGVWLASHGVGMPSS
jgi:hemolysin III